MKHDLARIMYVLIHIRSTDSSMSLNDLFSLKLSSTRLQSLSFRCENKILTKF